MEIKSVHDGSFKKYGEVLQGYDWTELLGVLEQTTEKLADSVVYVPGDDALESTRVYTQLRDNAFGGMPIQMGYCNGTNSKLNCLEYHRGSEVNVAADDIVLLLAELRDVQDGKLDTAKVEAFEMKKGEGVLLYETSLHYAPARREGGFRVVVVLPHYTNTEKPAITRMNDEDKLLWARNKWLIAHPETSEAQAGAYVGLMGENIDIAK